MKEASIDTSETRSENEKYMVDSEVNVINYDMFLEMFFRKESNFGSYKPASIDALCMVNDQWCFIEFKNGKISTSVKKEISEKIGHSILTLLKHEQMKINDFCENSIFILVYNENINNEITSAPSKAFTIQHILSKANNTIIRFRLERFKTIYFKDVYTFSKKEFSDFLTRVNISLPKTENSYMQKV